MRRFISYRNQMRSLVEPDNEPYGLRPHLKGCRLVRRCQKRMTRWYAMEAERKIPAPVTHHRDNGDV